MTKTKLLESAAPSERRLIDVREVARMAGGVGTATIPRWAADGILPKPVKIGHLVRWWQHEVEAALAKLPRTDQPSARPYVLAERRSKSRAKAKAKGETEAKARGPIPAVGEKAEPRPKRPQRQPQLARPVAE
jgi:predicted DNA-binding transcriptional regulator AlpA